MFISAMEEKFDSKDLGIGQDDENTYDDTGMNQLRFKCRNIFGTTETDWIVVGATDLGEWKESEWSSSPKK